MIEVELDSSLTSTCVFCGEKTNSWSVIETRRHCEQMPVCPACSEEYEDIDVPTLCLFRAQRSRRFVVVSAALTIFELVKRAIGFVVDRSNKAAALAVERNALIAQGQSNLSKKPPKKQLKQQGSVRLPGSPSWTMFSKMKGLAKWKL